MPWMTGTSRVVTAPMATSPSPGTPKTCSTSTAPPSSAVICRPSTVTSGTLAFLSTCLPITIRSRRPFARAVRT
jgi:hypothetical protein